MLTAGLPLIGEKLTPELFMRSAEHIGLSARAVRWELSELVSVYLPAVLQIKGGRSIVLFAFSDRGEADVYLPQAGGMSKLPFAELKALYEGLAILVKPEYRVGAETGLETRQSSRPLVLGHGQALPAQLSVRRARGAVHQSARARDAALHDERVRPRAAQSARRRRSGFSASGSLSR